MDRTEDGNDRRVNKDLLCKLFESSSLLRMDWENQRVQLIVAVVVVDPLRLHIDHCTA